MPAWGDDEKNHWLSQQEIKRSYHTDVLPTIEACRDRFDVEQYGSLHYDTKTYPLFAVKTRNFDSKKKSILVTGGVHGYETSGIKGALAFANTRAQEYATHFNIVVCPCISPWAYETINRWNPKAIDPNRNFVPNSPCEESAAVMTYVKSYEEANNCKFFAHIDLHETTDTDNSTFRPLLAARDGKEPAPWTVIPDGYYLVSHTQKPVPEFQRAIIQGVEALTHIAPPDADGKIIGVTISQHGVIDYDATVLGLCMGFTDAPYVTTTEMYPDSPKTDADTCNLAQVASITSGLDYLLRL